uniref:Protein transport protein Sec16A-like n=1 Tax=Saccoglossus kowalevskii TaxID=10224 RepID=A0ABM0MFH9_SACKO|nr:PREDICTED: protein transport protein Sec16A-like [Saccoglossus kowalevskii]
MKGGLWGHALLLASKMDTRTYANVMMRFANSLPMNDPLQTLYQLMSGRQPAASTCCADEKWGDWRPHLSMLLSNMTNKADLDRKSITTMGDTLGAKSLLHASQFCYIMAQVGLGVYTKKSTKMVLLGSSHSLPFFKFATNEAIQHTEVYEYAQLLANKHYLLPNYQVYKFIYAARLAEHGFSSQALQYCEVITSAICLAPQLYNNTLISQLYELGSRLKHHDTQDFSGEDLIEPGWLIKLHILQQQVLEGVIKPRSSSATPMPWVYSSNSLSGVESLDTPIIGLSVDNSFANLQDYIGSFDMSDVGNQDRTQQHLAELKQKAVEQLGLGQGFTMTASGFQQSGSQSHLSLPASTHGLPVQQEVSAASQIDHSAPGEHAQQQSNFNFSQFQYNAVAQQPQENVDLTASMNSEYSTTSMTESGAETSEFADSGASKLDYYDVSVQQNQGVDDDSHTPSTISPKSPLTPPETPKFPFVPPRQQPPPQIKHDVRTRDTGKKEDKLNKPKKSAGGRSWFGGIFSSWRSKEVHLPDDSTKSIQWDPVKKKWVNAEDGDDMDEPDQAPPPPTDFELNKSSGSTPGSSAPTSSASTPGANRFQRPKEKFTARNNYVDVFNPGGTKSTPAVAPPPDLFPMMPTSSTGPVNFFVPEPVQW